MRISATTTKTSTSRESMLVNKNLSKVEQHQHLSTSFPRKRTAFAGLQTRTPQVARSVSAMDGASLSSVLGAVRTKSLGSGSPLRGIRNDEKTLVGKRMRVRLCPVVSTRLHGQRNRVPSPAPDGAPSPGGRGVFSGFVSTITSPIGWRLARLQSFHRRFGVCAPPRSAPGPAALPRPAAASCRSMPSMHRRRPCP